MGRLPAHSYHAVHNVAFRENSSQLSVAKHRQGTDVMFHHESRSLQYSPAGFNGIHFAVFHEVAEGGHGKLLYGRRGERREYFAPVPLPLVRFRGDWNLCGWTGTNKSGRLTGPTGLR